MPPRIALVSDDHVLRSHLLDCVHLDQSCVSGRAGIDPFSRTTLRSGAPNIVLIDCDVAGSLRLCENLASTCGTRVVMIAVPREGDTAVDALTAGARGIVYKKEPLSDVAKAVAAVGKGLVWAPRHIVVAAWTRTRSRAAHPETAADPNVAGRLSDREREVFRYAATGLGNRELADRLSISEATVKVHLTHIFQKLGVHSRGALAAAYFGIHR